MATPTGYTDLRNPVPAMSHGLPVLEVEPHIRTSSPLGAASLNTPQHMHRSPTRLSDLNTSPSFCQRRLQPHLHPAGYGNDRANLRSTAFAKMCNIGSFATATDNIIEASNRGGGPACHQRRIDREKKTRLTRRVFAYVNAFSLLCDRVRLTRLSPFF
jgi:hypothetical protein